MPTVKKERRGVLCFGGGYDSVGLLHIHSTEITDLAWVNYGQRSQLVEQASLRYFAREYGKTPHEIDIRGVKPVGHPLVNDKGKVYSISRKSGELYGRNLLLFSATLVRVVTPILASSKNCHVTMLIAISPFDDYYYDNSYDFIRMLRSILKGYGCSDRVTVRAPLIEATLYPEDGVRIINTLLPARHRSKVFYCWNQRKLSDKPCGKCAKCKGKKRLKRDSEETGIVSLGEDIFKRA